MKIRREGGFLIAKIHQVAGRIFAKALRDAGIDAINPAQGRILFALGRTDVIPSASWLEERCSATPC